MRNSLGFMMVLGIAVCFGAGQATLADYYDQFNDGHYWQDPNDEPLDSNFGSMPFYNLPPYDPNAYDIDNPHWGIVGVMGTNYLADASDGWLRLYAEMDFLPYMLIGGFAVDDNTDPNTSTTWFDDSAPHYILTRAKAYDTDKGELIAMIHADPAYWTGWCADLELDWETPGNPNTHNLFAAAHVNATEWQGRGFQNRPELQTHTGFWLICQFDGDGDPNHSRLKVAAWNGGKYDWDGVWDIDTGMTTDWDPNARPYYSEGLSGVATLGSPQNGSPLDVDAKFDEIECRWGMFTNVSRTLKLTVSHSNWGTVQVDPNLVDPNDPTLQRYTHGTGIVLTATPVSGKAFREWTIYDPNFPGDISHAVTDSNTVLYLTMNANWDVGADFKCGSGLEPLLGIGLLALTVGVLIRRLT